MGPNTLKIKILTFDCRYCKSKVEEWGKTEEEALDRGIKHFYNHEYPNWRQLSSIETFDEYKSKFIYELYEDKS